MMAERAGIALNTLTRIEKGDQGASMAAWASVLFVLRLTENLRDLTDPVRDLTGLMLEEEQLPKRIRHKNFFGRKNLLEDCGFARQTAGNPRPLSTIPCGS